MLIEVGSHLNQDLHPGIRTVWQQASTALRDVEYAPAPRPRRGTGCIGASLASVRVDRASPSVTAPSAPVGSNAWACIQSVSVSVGA